MAGPKRIPWKNKVMLDRQYKWTFYIHMMIGSVLTYPFAVFIGRRARTYGGGVPVVPYQRWVHDFPNVEPARKARLAFRFACIGTCLLGGHLFAT